MLVTKKKRTKTLLIILGLVILGGLFFNLYLVDKFFSPKDEESIIMGLDLYTERLTSEWSKISLDLFEDKLFKELKKYGDWPVKVKEKGRLNPFLKPR